jgi:hypothetical protein
MQQVLMILFLVSAPAVLRAQETDKPADPVEEKKPVAVTITVDASEVPELEAWAEAARQRCELWHPLIARALGYDGEPRHKDVRIVLKKNMRGIAGTSGARISVSADYVQRHPDDDGMIVHELVHVVQAYPKYDPPWLVEGLADYVRYWHYEPGKRSFGINPERSKYSDSYGTTARFLAWVQVAKDEQIIHKLDAALRSGEYREEIFEQATGRTIDQLWTEFVRSAERRP